MAKKRVRKTITTTQPESQVIGDFGELPEGVEVVTVQVPVYVGEVPTDRPYSIDQLQLKLLSQEQRIGVNRVFAAIERLAIRDESIEPASTREFQPFMRSRGESSRWVFARIAKAVAEQFGG